MLIYNATIINENRRFVGSIVIKDEHISHIYEGAAPTELITAHKDNINAQGLWLIPGVIDDQVHFREPGLTHKADIYTESRAAVAGGVTSFMDMPNTKPQTTTQALLEEKYALGAENSIANYSFYIGATNENLAELKKTDPHTVCGVKVFMGSSTGNMLVDDTRTLERIFAEVPLLIATHNEDEATIQANKARCIAQWGENPPIECHPIIRNAEACYKSSVKAVELAHKHNTRLHILHLSTEKELGLFDTKPLADKKITAEVCVHHLWFSDQDYAKYGNRIKWNPAIKRMEDRDALRQAINEGKIDVVATDHAPHLRAEKEGSCLQAASGGPMVQHSLVAMLELAAQGCFTPEKVVEKMCHAPADLFRIHNRGYIREGYYADLVLVNPDSPWQVDYGNLLSKCGWSPMEGVTFRHKVSKTFVNGYLVYDDGHILEGSKGQRLLFDR